MREIKFRLRIGDKIVGYERIKPDEDGYLISTYSFDNSIGGWIFKSIKHKDKDQFIGLKDKNGKEIYEGDILTAPKINNYKPIFKVVYEEYDTAFSAFDIKAGCWVKLNAFDYEIVGNIYENPELLEKEKNE